MPSPRKCAVDAASNRAALTPSNPARPAHCLIITNSIATTPPRNRPVNSNSVPMAACATMAKGAKFRLSPSSSLLVPLPCLGFLPARCNSQSSARLTRPRSHHPTLLLPSARRARSFTIIPRSCVLGVVRPGSAGISVARNADEMPALPGRIQRQPTIAIIRGEKCLALVLSKKEQP